MKSVQLLALAFLISTLTFAKEFKNTQKVYWGVGVDQFYNCKLLKSGNIILVGRTDSHRNGGHQNKDGWALMIDSSLNTLLSKAIGGVSKTDRFWDVKEKPSGDLVFVGSSGSFGGSENIYVVQTDSNLNLKDSYNYGELGYESAYDIELQNDGEWTLIGDTRSTYKKGNSQNNLVIVRADSCGRPL